MYLESIFLFSIILGVNFAEAHSLFNSAEEFVGSYRVQVATLPEFPQVGETSQILFRITDSDFNEVKKFTLGYRVFFNDVQIDARTPQLIESSHLEIDYVFRNPGNHIFKVDLYDMPDSKDVLTYTFNMSTQSPFGYIFFISIIIGAIMLSIVICYILLSKKRKFFTSLHK